MDHLRHAAIFSSVFALTAVDGSSKSFSSANHLIFFVGSEGREDGRKAGFNYRIIRQQVKATSQSLRVLQG
jgi:hypothetical protein